MSTFFLIKIHRQGNVCSKTLQQQNPPVLNCSYWLIQVDLYTGHKTVVCVYIIQSSILRLAIKTVIITSTT